MIPKHNTDITIEERKESILTHLKNKRDFIDECRDCQRCVLSGACGSYLNVLMFNSISEQRKEQFNIIKKLAEVYLTEEEIFESLL